MCETGILKFCHKHESFHFWSIWDISLINTKFVTFRAVQCLGPCRIIFRTKKSQDPCRHNSTKIIGPCHYVYEKKCWPGRCIDRRSFPNPAGVWRHCQPPSVYRTGLWWGSREQSPWKLQRSCILHFKNSKTICIFEFLSRIVPSCLIRLQKNLEKWVSILVKVKNNSGWVKKYTRLTSHSIASIASILKIRLGLDR